MLGIMPHSHDYHTHPDRLAALGMALALVSVFLVLDRLVRRLTNWRPFWL